MVGRSWSGGTPFSILARSISEEVISMARSAASGAVTFGKCEFEHVYRWMLCMSISGTELVESAECAGRRQCLRV